MRSRRFVRRRERALHRVDPGLLTGGPDFRGKKKRITQMQFTRQVADHAFGPAIHRRAIDHLAAELDETAKHFFERGALVRRIADVESARRAEADCGNFLAGGRNRTQQHM